MSLPIIKATGTHYEVGRQIGTQVKQLLQRYFETVEKDFLKTDECHKLYSGYLKVTNDNYPQYVEELQGIADGAGVSFEKIFMSNLYELVILERKSEAMGLRCTDVFLNTESTQVIAHNEDALSKECGYSFIVDVCCINDRPRGRLLVPEERFVSYCYPGALSGAAFSYNSDGLVTTVNYITGKYVKKDRLPMSMLLRASLSASSPDHLTEIIRNVGSGVGTAVSMNAAFLSNKDVVYIYEIYNKETDERVQTNFKLIEIKKRNESVPTESVPTESHSSEPVYGYYYHCNQLRLVPDACDATISSQKRTEFLENSTLPQTKADLCNILSHPRIWRPIESMDGHEDGSLTLACAIFDLANENLEVYTSKRPSLGGIPDITLKLDNF
ncbi:beta-alanyl-dopamine/carcinine hydrolase-like [Tubulanus polymorphus]|uniref:beta-alanyl-dopamine/carcinine hydrolase-like n=1 Tax=Tubulanus polymorphus TaxID=672921 RepID=UPI003DA2710B